MGNLQDVVKQVDSSQVFGLIISVWKCVISHLYVDDTAGAIAGIYIAALMLSADVCLKNQNSLWNWCCFEIWCGMQWLVLQAEG